MPRQSIINGANPRKSLSFLQEQPIPNKKMILNIKDYFESCLQTPGPTKSIQELQKNLRASKNIDSNTGLSQEEIVYTNYFKDKTNEIFCVNTKESTKADIYEIKSHKGIENAIFMMKELKRIINGYFLVNYGQKVSKIVCDFADDYYQNLYFLKLKNYQFMQIQDFQLKRPPLFTSFLCPGKHCKNKQNSGIKAFNERKFSVLKKKLVLNEQSSETDPLLMLNPNFYEKVRVCAECFKYYNENKINKKTSSSFHINKLSKTEASSILEEINPINAADTIVSMPKKTNNFLKTSSTKFSDAFDKKKPGRKSVPVEEKFRKEFFDQKKFEILQASLEASFF